MSAAAVIFNGSRFIVGGSGGVIATTYALATNQVMRLNAAAFTVTSVVDPDHYTVDASAPATSAQGYGGYTPLHGSTISARRTGPRSGSISTTTA